MSTEEIEVALTAVLLAGKELGVASAVGNAAELRQAELTARCAHQAARQAAERFAARSYEAGLELGRRSALGGRME